MHNQSIDPNKLNRLRKAAKYFDGVRITHGDDRRRIHGRLDDLKCKRHVTEFDNEVAASAEIEKKFKKSYEAYLSSVTLLERCSRWLQAQGYPMPEPETAPPPAKFLLAQKTAETDAILDSLCDPKKSLALVETNHILIAAHSEQLKKAITAHIEKTIGKAGLSVEQKATQLAALDQEIVQLEQKEERICMAIEAAGAFVARRADFPPAIFFAVSAEDGETQNGAAAHSLMSAAVEPSAM
jgi:hypothetical protein